MSTVTTVPGRPPESTEIHAPSPTPTARECRATIVITDAFGTRTEIVDCRFSTTSTTVQPTSSTLPTPTTSSISTAPAIPTTVMPYEPGRKKNNSIILFTVIPLVVTVMLLFAATLYYRQRRRKKRDRPSQGNFPNRRRRRPKVRSMLAEKVKRSVKKTGMYFGIEEWWRRRRRKLIKSSITHTRTVWNMPEEVKDILEGTSIQPGIFSVQRSPSLQAVPAYFTPERNKKVEEDLEDLRAKGLVMTSSRPTSPLDLASIPTRSERSTPVLVTPNRSSGATQQLSPQTSPQTSPTAQILLPSTVILPRGPLPPVQEVPTPAISFIQPVVGPQSCVASTYFCTDVAPETMSEFERRYQKEHVHPAFRMDGTPLPSSLSIPIILVRSGTTPEQSTIQLAVPQLVSTGLREQATEAGRKANLKENDNKGERSQPPSASTSFEGISDGSSSVLEMKRVSQAPVDADRQKKRMSINDPNKPGELKDFTLSEEEKKRYSADDNSYIEPLQPVAMEIERPISPSPLTNKQNAAIAETASLPEKIPGSSSPSAYSPEQENQLGLGIYVPTSSSPVNTLPKTVEEESQDLRKKLSSIPIGKLHIPAWIHSAPSEVSGYAAGGGSTFLQENEEYISYEEDGLIEPKDSISVVENWMEKEKVGPDGRAFTRENSLEKKEMEREIKNMERFLKRMELEYGGTSSS